MWPAVFRRQGVETCQLGFDVTSARMRRDIEQPVAGQIPEQTAATDPVVLVVVPIGQVHEFHAAPA